MLRPILIATAIATLALATPVSAAESVTTTIKDHQFSPNTIRVPANQAFSLTVKNDDDTPEEFESHDLRIEKVIGAHREATIPVRALKPGSYRFVGEFNEATAKGLIIAE